MVFLCFWYSDCHLNLHLSIFATLYLALNVATIGVGNSWPKYNFCDQQDDLPLDEKKLLDLCCGHRWS